MTDKQSITEMLTRRRFLGASGMIAGGVLVGACGSDDDDTVAATTTAAARHNSGRHNSGTYWWRHTDDDDHESDARVQQPQCGSSGADFCRSNEGLLRRGRHREHRGQRRG